MSVKLLLILASFGALLVGCVGTGNDDGGLDRMQRNQRSALETAG